MCYFMTLTVIKIMYRLRFMDVWVWSIGGVTQVLGEELFQYRFVYHNRHMDWRGVEFAPASNRPSRRIMDNLLSNKAYSGRK